MAAKSKVTLYLFAVLVPLALVYSQESTSVPNTPEIPSFPWIPNFLGIPNFPRSPNIPGIPSIPGIPDIRGIRDAPNPDSDDHHERFFLPRLIRCDYSTEPGLSCRNNCTQAVYCNFFGIGVIQNCTGIFQYCNRGFCSLYPEDSCTTTTTSTTTVAYT